jgi:uncharacterized phiE125 gp8 family phage protein
MTITSLRVITAATEMPITLAEAKAHLRITHNAEDAHIQSLILAATDWAQTESSRIFVNTQVALKLDVFPSDKIPLLGGNVTAVNDIDYSDVDGNPQTLTGPTSQTPGTDYQEDLTDDEVPFLCAAEAGWPTVESNVVNAVLIDYQVGWLTPEDVPGSIQQAIKFKLADLFTIRDTIDAGSKSELLRVAENLLYPYQLPSQ